MRWYHPGRVEASLPFVDLHVRTRVRDPAGVENTKAEYPFLSWGGSARARAPESRDRERVCLAMRRRHGECSIAEVFPVGQGQRLRVAHPLPSGFLKCSDWMGTTASRMWVRTSAGEPMASTSTMRSGS